MLVRAIPQRRGSAVIAARCNRFSVSAERDRRDETVMGPTLAILTPVARFQSFSVPPHCVHTRRRPSGLSANVARKSPSRDSPKLRTWVPFMAFQILIEPSCLPRSPAAHPGLNATCCTASGCAIMLKRVAPVTTSETTSRLSSLPPDASVCRSGEEHDLGQVAGAPTGTCATEGAPASWTRGRAAPPQWDALR